MYIDTKQKNTLKANLDEAGAFVIYHNFRYSAVRSFLTNTKKQVIGSESCHCR